MASLYRPLYVRISSPDNDFQVRRTWPLNDFTRRVYYLLQLIWEVKPVISAVLPRLFQFFPSFLPVDGTAKW